MKQEYGKPMSLSYVMDTPAYQDSYQDILNAPSSLPPLSPQSVHSTSSAESPSSSSSSTSLTYHGEEYPHHRHHHRRYQVLSDEEVENYSNSAGTGGVGVLTLLERRQRNKTASAKYRQKKNRQQSEMKRMIDNLTEQDALLKRQMVELKLENQRLKSMNDHLRGKILAKKMLDQYFERHHLPTPPYFSPPPPASGSVPTNTNTNNNDDAQDNDSLDSF